MRGSRAAYEAFNDRDFDRAAALVVEALEWVNVAGSTHNIGAYELGSTSTLAPDTTPPEISNVQVSNIKRRSVTITWTTDLVSTTSVQCGRTTAYGKLKLDTAFIVRRSMILTGLSTDTRYRCRVTSEDEAGNDTAYTELTFRTAR